MLCNSCRNKASNERCPSFALKNLQFCGKHAKAKNPRLWSVVNSADRHAIVIQKMWRGWIVRHMLRLAGSGVLKRSVCHNGEDVVTFESNVHPFDYFSFEEEKFIYWFDAKTLYQITISNAKPLNPYTRKELSLETRQRLKEFTTHRKFRNREMFHEPRYLADRDKLLFMYWISICQSLEENLFIELNPSMFLLLNQAQLWTFVGLLRHDLLMWAKEHKSVQSQRNLYYIWIHNCWKYQTYTLDPNNVILTNVGKTILKILDTSKHNYEICFKILTALHSL